MGRVGLGGMAGALWSFRDATSLVALPSLIGEEGLNLAISETVRTGSSPHWSVRGSCSRGVLVWCGLAWCGVV